MTVSPVQGTPYEYFYVKYDILDAGDLYDLLAEDLATGAPYTFTSEDLAAALRWGGATEDWLVTRLIVRHPNLSATSQAGMCRALAHVMRTGRSSGTFNCLEDADLAREMAYEMSHNPNLTRTSVSTLLEAGASPALFASHAAVGGVLLDELIDLLDPADSFTFNDALIRGISRNANLDSSQAAALLLRASAYSVENPGMLGFEAMMTHFIDGTWTFEYLVWDEFRSALIVGAAAV